MSTPTSPSRRLLALAAAMAMLLAACGSDDGSSAASISADDLFNTPLAEYDGRSSFTTEEGQEDMVSQLAEAEEEIASCMREQGFQYVVVDQSALFGNFGGAGWFEDPFDAEFTEEFGFGISTTFEDTLENLEELTGAGDPNQEIRMALSETEGAAYDSALYGSFNFEDMGDDPANFEPDPSQMGCSAVAMEVFGDMGGSDELSDAMDDLEERISADSRIVDADAAWATCMAESGYEYATFDEMFNDVSERMEPVFESIFPTDFTEESAEGDFGINADNLDVELLNEAQTHELAVAAGNFDCQPERLAAEVEVRTELEGAFVDQYRDQLEAANG